MKKIIAVLSSISILVATHAPLAAQALLPAARKAGQVATVNAGKVAAQTSRLTQQTANFVLKSAANQSTPKVTLPTVQMTARPYQVQPPLLAPEQAAQLQRTVERSVRQAVLTEPLSFEQIVYRANHGKTAFLPQAILDISNVEHRKQLLRSAFVTATAAGDATAEELEIAVKFWRTDLSEQLSHFDKLPTTLNLSTEEALPFVQGLQDAAALALFGTEQDLFILKQLWDKTKLSSLEPMMAALWTRGLISRGNWAELEKFFIDNDGKFAELQNGIAAYVEEENIPAQIPSTDKTNVALNTKITQVLQGWGPVLASSANESLAATKLWVLWSKNRPQPAVRPAEKPLAAAGKQIQDPVIPTTLGQLLTDITVGAAPVQAAALPAIEEGALPMDAPVAPAVESSAAPVVTAAANLPADNSLQARFQRASLYLASFVMGLEVATPVIANFGSSFGLSLEDNILVAAATYTPYSVGALASNWTKKFLGRKGSMNLGLAMMATGLLGGVNWVGLNGSFVPEADTMLQFYKALACITLASTGGVFIHNSVGPIMMELSAKTTDLIRQRRSTTTELSRALGMAASFAFPFIATKVLGYDWSFAFALPIPLVITALLGTSLIKLPNTRPVIKHATEHLTQAGTSLWQRIKNNEYIRLFKEEKGAGALLAGLAIMNAVEMGINNGFLFMLPSLTTDPSSQYLFGMAQFAAPFILGRYLAKRFLDWFPKRNLSVANGLAAAGSSIALLPGVVDNVYALTTALFLAETGISTLFTLSFARTAKNPATVDRLTALIVASALSCAIGPMIFSDVTQALINSGMGTNPATAAAMIGIPAALTLLASRLFRRVEFAGKETPSSLSKLKKFIKNSLFFPKQRRKRA